MDNRIMVEDRDFCSSSFLMYRTITDRNKTFKKGWLPKLFVDSSEYQMVCNSEELQESLKAYMHNITANKKTVLALSGGIDSAILAKFMPKGSTAYTFKCIVPGMEVTDETRLASQYAEECNLEHKIIEIYWQDFLDYAPVLMKHKKSPIHSIEVQIYKAALRAKEEGFDQIIFGESADLLYGGLSDLMSREWTFGEFVERYAYVHPWMVLKNPIVISDNIAKHTYNGLVDVQEFNTTSFLCEAMGSYSNACETAGISLKTPYYNTRLAVPINYERIRAGENKYLIREIFNKLYPSFKVPAKVPMPRPMNEWMRDWTGPQRDEFWENCAVNMTGDQKWLLFSLEIFLDICDSTGE